MKKYLRRYPVTATALGIAALLLSLELYLRYSSRESILHGILEFPMIMCALALLCPSLERWLTSKKMAQPLCGTAAFALLTNAGMMMLNGWPVSWIGFAGSIYLLCLVAGIAFALSLTGGDKTDGTFRLPLLARIIPALLLFGIYISSALDAHGLIALPPGVSWSIFSYCLGVGTFGGIYFSWQNQVVTNHRVFDQTRVLPAYVKPKWRQHPGTLCLLGGIILIALATVITTPKQHLTDAYGSAGFSAWLRYIFWGVFGWAAGNVLPWTGISRETLLKGQLWRPFTSALMHYGPLHLLGNGLALYFAGKNMEPRVGTFKWLGVFYGAVWFDTLLALLSTNQLVYDGASKGIYPLVAVFFLFSFKKGEMIRSRPYEIGYLFGYLLIGEFLSYGHFPVFVIGLAAAFLLLPRSSPRSRANPASRRAP